MNANPDVLSLTVTNELPKTVENITICMVAHNEANQAIWPEGKNFSSFNNTLKRNLYIASWENVDLKPGGSKVLTIDCKHAFAGVRAIVARVSVKAGDVTVDLDNPILEEWCELALGSPTHYFD